MSTGNIVEKVDQALTQHPRGLELVGNSTGGRGKRKGRRAVITWRIAILIGVVCLWEFGAGRIFDDYFTSKPSAIAAVWWQWVVSGVLWTNASSTFYSAFLGFCVGTVFALVFGYLLGSSRRAADITEPYITAFYTLPKLALVPLFVMWFGLGRQLEVVIAAVVVFFLMFYSVFFGIREVDKQLIDSIRVMGGSRFDVAWRVRFPSAVAWLIAGLKITVPQCLIAVVVAEILASSRGLGYLVAYNSAVFDSAGAFAAILTLLAIGLIVDRLVGVFSKRALRWKADV